MRTRLTAFLLLVWAVFALPVSGANLPTIEAVSGADPSLSRGLSARGDSMGSMLAPSGTFVLFTSSAGDLVPGGHEHGVLDLYLRNRTNGLVTLVSVNATGTGGGNGHSAYAAITPDGRYVAFESLASNLVAGDTNAASDVFVRDVASGTTSLVSVNTAGTASGDGASSSPAMTPDERCVAFVSAATDLVADDTNGIPDVFVRDLQTGVTTLVSVGAQADNRYDVASASPAISADGQYVAFASTATNLGVGVPDSRGGVFVRDLVAGTTTWASSNLASVLGTVRIENLYFYRVLPSSWSPVLSDDGRFLTFKNWLTYQPAGSAAWYSGFVIARWGRDTGGIDLVTTNAQGNTVGFPDPSGPAMTPDGRFIGYTSAVSTTNTSDVFVWDAQSGIATLASVAVDGVSGAAGFTDTPSLSPDGRLVTFVSNATNLVPHIDSREFRVYQRDLQSGLTSLVTVDETGAPAGQMDAAIPTVSDDGRWAAIDSRSADLVAGDQNDAFDVFVRDTEASQLELVSSRDEGLAGVTGNGRSSVGRNCLSADARYLVFTSLASDLVVSDTNEFQDVFVRDLQTGSTTLASIATDGTQADSPSHTPVISADGGSVAFGSSATNLAGQVTNRADNIYLRDPLVGTSILVSVSTNGVNGGNGVSSAPSISANGKRVAFQSLANNVASGDTDPYEDIFVRDFGTGVTYLISSDAPDGTVLTRAYSPVISADGRFVVFTATVSQPPVDALLVASDLQDGSMTVVATNFSFPAISADSRTLVARSDPGSSSPSNQLLLHDLIQRTNTVVTLPGTVGFASLSGWGMSLSSDGQFVALANAVPIAGDETNGVMNVFLYDARTLTVTLVSRSRDENGDGDGASDSPSISADGRFVVYRSDASDLVPERTSGQSQVFLYDRLGSRNALISRNRNGTSGANGLSKAPVISANGRMVVFASLEDDLIAGDFNQTQDVFLCHVVVAPWVEVLGPSGGGTITLQWDANPGETYQVQQTTGLGVANWEGSPGQITIVGSKASWIEPVTASPEQRFYRVAVVE